ncbi:PD40 domain-containing protein [Fulvivirgaceae bacterium PWU4]|uniref:PD40 domain-containing protein n=1 Tax=Chryseosolibacter histidini TaxID=2782349 RepID=A0AAP2GIY1_9BACT|nr:hypothetical protein [Chryseosolibacter histidini]MBT1697464.1 PD40 domain-containing protein [Chryseosolibacter histidini]
MKKLLPFVFLLLTGHAHFGQTILENNPPSLKWRQINTPNFRVLFPKGFEDQGQRVANTLEHIHAEEARSMGATPRKISVILQNQSSISNGFVSVLPRRSEFYAMPPQDYNFIGNNDWLDMLMSHEYRHIVQYQHAKRGFNRLFYYLFGATTFAGMAQAAAPPWFWEGDAVATETAFTPTGRGKIPYFGLVFKTNLLEGREFNYHKQALRSYKHNIPNEYVLGYYMISYLRKRTNDPEIWEKITKRSWSVPFIPFAFSNAIKKESGLYVTELYREMANDFQQEWQKQQASLTLTPFERVNPRNSSAYTDYLYPQVLEDGSVLAMKQGIGDIEQFVLLKDGKEKHVFTPGFVNDAGMLSSVGQKIVWNEYGFSPRWAVKNYSLVKTYDRDTKQRKVIGSRHERYASASLSPDASKIVTIRTNTQYQTQMVVLDASTGSILKEFPNAENHFFSMPRWSDDGKVIAVLENKPLGKVITLFDYSAGSVLQGFVVPQQENVGHPVLVGDYVLFNSPVSGIDNIYAIQRSTGQRYQVTSSKYGAYNPSLSKDGKTIFYNDQTRDGLDVVKAPFDPATWRPYKKEGSPVEFYSHLVEQEGDPGLFRNVPQQTLPVTKYSKLRGLINPYTWGVNVETDLTEATVGIVSRDILSTLSLSAGYAFDINERTGAWRAQASYQGWLPIIDVTASIADRSVDEGRITYGKVVSGDTVAVTDNLTFDWNEQTIEAGLRIPLNLTNSRFSTNLTFGNHVGYTSVTDFTNSIDGGGRIITSRLPQFFFRDYIDHGSLFYNHFSFAGYRLQKLSRRDINARWGQRVFIDAYNTATTLDVPGMGRRRFGDYTGKQFSFYGLLYFPGLVKHHSLWGYWAFQSTELTRANAKTGEGLDSYMFRNQIPLPRGQSVSRFEEFYSMSANYTLPVWYPDIAIGPLVNIQRLRANLFFDYGFGQSPTYRTSQTYTSTGIEAKLDINILRFLPQFDIGVRYAQGLSPSVSKFEVLVGTFNF